MARRPLNEIETPRRLRVSSHALMRTIAVLGAVVVVGGASLAAGTKDRIANTVRPVAGTPGKGMDKPTPLNANLVARESTRTGKAWVAAADGGVFIVGDAKFHGSGASLRRAAPYVSMTRTRTGRGYYLLGADGRVFTHGDAKFRGAAVDGHRATSISLARTGDGYQIARSDGSVRGFGGQPSIAAPRNVAANQHPVVAIASRPGVGARLVHGYNPPPPKPEPKPKPNPKVAHRDLSQDPFLKCTRAHESDSAGGYRAVSPGGVYRGAYQFLRSTWNNVARRAGRFDLVGVDPAAASPADQDAMAWSLFQSQGRAPWGGRCAGLS